MVGRRKRKGQAVRSVEAAGRRRRYFAARLAVAADPTSAVRVRADWLCSALRNAPEDVAIPVAAQAGAVLDQMIRAVEKAGTKR